MNSIAEMIKHEVEHILAARAWRIHRANLMNGKCHPRTCEWCQRGYSVEDEVPF
jgi:hypothetical protein